MNARINSIGVLTLLEVNYVLEVLGYNDIYVVRTTYMLLYPIATGDTYGAIPAQ